jgi:hypothetical protein
MDNLFVAISSPFGADGSNDHPASLSAGRCCPFPGILSAYPLAPILVHDEAKFVFIISDIGVHDAPISLFTIKRYRCSRWADIAVHDADIGVHDAPISVFTMPISVFTMLRYRCSR